MAEEFKRDPANGMLIGPDGCHYQSIHAVHHFARLGLCGCGSPEGAFNFCREALTIFDRRGDKGGDKWINAEDALSKLIASKSDDAAHVFAHLLTHLDLLEHGGSVGGSWLTDKGNDIVDLREAVESDFDF